MFLVVDGLEFKYKSKEILKNISFKLEREELVAILGNNGAGKSTLLKCICKILKPNKGVILIDNFNLNKLSIKEISKKIGYIAQKNYPCNMTVFDYLLLGRKPHINWNVGERDIKIVEDIIKMLNLEDYALKNLNELSGGEQQKIIIGRALVQEPEILLLDEPTNNLDLRNQLEIMNIIKNLTKKRNILTITVLHDLNLALRYCDKYILMKDGKIYGYGNKKIINENSIKEVYGVNATIKNIDNIPIVIPFL
ncbi:ABC transporter ATP-binding protein [Methanocaldococcus sp.]